MEDAFLKHSRNAGFEGVVRSKTHDALEGTFPFLWHWVSHIVYEPLSTLFTIATSYDEPVLTITNHYEPLLAIIKHYHYLLTLG